MIYSKEMVLNQPYYCTYERLSRQMQTSTKIGTLQSSTFKLYKAISYSKQRNVFTFCFTGEIHDLENQTKITYVVRPNIIVCLAAIVLEVSFISGLIRLILDSGSTMFLLFGMLFHILFYGLIIAQEKACVREFEKSIRG